MKLLFQIIALFFASTLFSQSSNFFKIGEKDLKGLEVYSLLFHNDLLFVTTNNGLYKQSSSGFKSIPFRNEKSNSLFDLTEDNKGNLFCKSLSGQLFQFTNDSLSLFYEMDKNHMTDNFYFFFDDDNSLITTGDVVNKILPNGKVINLTRTVTADSISKKIHTYFAHKTTSNSIFISAGFNDSYSFLYENNVLKKIKTKPENVKNMGGHLFFYEKDSSQFFLCQNGCFYSPTQGLSKITREQNEGYLILRNGDLLAMNDKKGARILSVENNTLIEKNKILSHQFTSCAIQGEQKSIYFGTFGEGIIVLPNYDQISIDLPLTLTGIANDKQEVFVSSREGVIVGYDGEINTIDSLGVKIDNVFYTSVPTGDEIQKKHHLLYRKDVNKYGAIKDVCVLNDSLTLYVDHLSIGVLSSQKINFDLNSYFIVDSSSNDSYHYRSSIKERYVAVSSLDIKKAIYVSTGIKTINQVSGKELLFNNSSISTNTIVQYKDWVILGTKNKGLLFYKNEVLDKVYEVSDGLLSNRIIKLKLYNENLVIQSQGGIQVLNLEETELYNLGTKQSVNLSEIKDFDVLDSTIWIMEKNKFYNVSFDLIFNKKEELVFFIDSFYVNNNEFPYSKINTLSSDQNRIKIILNFNDILQKQDAFFTYSIVGFDEKEQTLLATQNEISYDYIPPGKYVLKITLHYNNAKSKTFEYSFSIAPPYYQSWWFFCLIGVSILLLFFLFFKIRVANINRRNLEQLEKEVLSKNLLDSELKAMRSQMNPHFMFNSLNSIQNLILKEDIDKSYDYIVMFSELVRSTLNYSEQEFISVTKELKFLEVYLELEKLRFKDDFEYEIISNVPDHIHVPSILIQPFIENALKHGLLHKKGVKKLRVELVFNESLVCIIKDNGVGREKAMEIKAKKSNSHRSFAMESITKRLQILSERYNNVFSYKVTDIIENGVPCGTEVYLVMPYRNTL